MTDALSRAFVADIEIRAGSNGEGRTVGGIVVPFGQIARVSDGGPSYDEAFERGAFKRTLDHMDGKFGRVKFLAQHNARTNPLGRATMLREDPAGLYGEFQVSKTRDGDDALELIRDGALDSFSVGFTPINHEKKGRVTWRTEVGLREASLVTFPAYAGALVTGVRDEWNGLTDEMREQAMAWLRDQTAAPLEGQMGTPDGPAPLDEDPALAPLRSIPQQRLAYRLALIERGIKPEQED